MKSINENFLNSGKNGKDLIFMIESFFSKYWIIWSIYFIIPQFIVDGIYQSVGYLFSYTGYYWILHVFILIAGIFIGKFYFSLLTKVLSLPLMVLEGYMYFRFLLEEIFYFNPYFYVLNIVVVIPMVLQVLWSLFTLIYKILLIIYVGISGIIKSNDKKAKNRLYNKIKPNSENIKAIKSSRIIQMGIICSLILLILLPISNAGFGDTIVVHDEGNTINRVGFWSCGYQGINPANYANPDAIEELELLRDINAFIMLMIPASALLSPSLNSMYTDLIYLYKSYDIEVVINANPITYFYNETSENWETYGDYVTYHHIRNMNYTIDLIMSWMHNESFSNVIGLSLDIEGPVNKELLNESSIISYEAYDAGLYSYSEKLKEFKEAFPGNETMQISMDHIMSDAFDGDFDLSVAQKTVDFELNFDKFGYMTYHLSDNPHKSSYTYYMRTKLGEQLHGDKYQPWIGWIGENDTMEDQIFYNHVVQHLKIAKNFADEIIIGYMPMFTSDNHDVAVERLTMLKEIIQLPYDDFTIKINHVKWDETIFPTYWMMDGAILMDIMFGHRTADGIMIPWFNLLQTSVILIPVILSVKKMIHSNQKKILKKNLERID